MSTFTQPKNHTFEVASSDPVASSLGFEALGHTIHLLFSQGVSLQVFDAGAEEWIQLRDSSTRTLRSTGKRVFVFKGDVIAGPPR